MGVSFSAAAIYLSNKIDNVLEKALVLDASGQVYNATSIEVDAMRKFEYEDHIKKFVSLWYSFDESTYERNIEEALHLIGNQGKMLFNEYNDVNMLNSLIQKNLRYGIIIKDLRVDMQTIPVSGEVLFILYSSSRFSMNTTRGFMSSSSEYSIYPARVSMCSELSTTSGNM